MTANTQPKVMVNPGYFDFDTPHYAAVYQFEQMPIPQPLRKNIEYRFYQTGHMIYMTPGALPRLHQNIARFIRETSTRIETAGARDSRGRVAPAS
ncbi:MAG: hypothetical protein ACYDAE_09920 [Steroidobacteraceae bacterium]